MTAIRPGLPALLAAALALALVSAVAAPAARADGDPASDVLTTQSLFLPQDAGVPPARQLQIQTLLRAAARAGFPIRVAVVSSSADLGSVTELWRQPHSYARFLAAELELVYRGPLLVVMPDGYGLAAAPSERAAVAALPAPGADAAAATLRAVQRLAAAAGHSLALPAQSMASRGAGADATAWLVFAGGWILILAAWGASLRARPLRVSGSQ